MQLTHPMGQAPHAKSLPFGSSPGNRSVHATPGAHGVSDPGFGGFCGDKIDTGVLKRRSNQCEVRSAVVHLSSHESEFSQSDGMDSV